MDKLDTMRAFLTVVQEGAFTKAADKLAVSPQLVSKYISALEKSLQTRLLHRTTRRLSLTQAGSDYYQRCLQVIADIDEMESRLTEHAQVVSGTLTISAPMSFGTLHLPQLLMGFQQRYPQIKLKITLTDIKVDIVDEGVDVAMRIGQLADSSYICKKVAPINIAIMASPDYLAARGLPKTPAELQHHHYLKYVYSDDAMLFSGFDNMRHTIDFNDNLIANNGELLVNTAILGGGIVIQPTFIAGKALAEGKLVRILQGYEPKPVGLYMVYANRQYLAPKVACFIEFVSQYYSTPPSWDQV
ncbi:LysR family transcriptional regulator [Shewanella saliphila]|uniref:LysR family transcriptional regulator n=1 Tax=Shewanella saliphila TaxID=2282698 RepID=A0ABQ2Q8E9_9GAMM|nr:LysR family transcriptional regulator [Shewanella saliphila]MCL1103082.1 LysR family transcriptional regulator [Shewanella saliphila]GGP60091.1 LysR family transcriptional regulator [Shewanella saliphila]